jgi:hypothetical protein
MPNWIGVAVSGLGLCGPRATSGKVVTLLKLCLVGFISLVLAGCSTDTHRSDLHSIPRSPELMKKIAIERKPPLLLRINTAQPAIIGQALSASAIEGEGSGIANKIIKDSIVIAGPYSLAFMPIVIPIAAALGATIESADKVAIEECKAQWGTDGNSMADWVREVFGREPLNEVLEVELRHRLSDRGLEQLLAPIEVNRNEWTGSELTEAVHSRSERTLIVGHVSQRFDWGLHLPERKCGIRLSLEVPLWAVELTPTSGHWLAINEIVVAHEAMDPKSRQNLLDDKDFARDWVRSTISELAAKIVEVYAP